MSTSADLPIVRREKLTLRPSTTRGTFLRMLGFLRQLARTSAVAFLGEARPFFDHVMAALIFVGGCGAHLALVTVHYGQAASCE